MMTRKKRTTLSIVLTVILIVIIITTLIILYLNTDLFKSNKTLFFKYIGKNTQNVSVIEEIFKNTEYNDSLQTNKYTENSEIKVNYTQNLKTTSENNDNEINKLKIEIEGQTDKTNQYNYKDIKLLNEDKQEMEIEYIQNENTYGVKFSDLFKQYILVENNNLKELLKNVGYTDEELVNFPDSIEINKNTFADIRFSEEEKQVLSDKYLTLISEELSKEQFEKKSKQVLTINQENIVANSYTLKLTKEQLNNLYIKVLENLKQDEIFLEKIDNLQNTLNKMELITSNNVDIKENVITNIEKMIDKINRNNIGNEEAKIIVYESEGDTIRTTIQRTDYVFNIDCLQMEDYKFYEVKLEENEEEIKKITINKKDGEIKIFLKYTENNIPISVDFTQNQSIEDSNRTKNINIKYEDDNNRVETIISQNINIVNDFNEQVTLTNENSIKLNTMNSEQLQTIFNKVNEGVENKLNILGQEIKIEDIQEVLKIIGVIQDNQKLEGNGVSETEKNRFNSKFEILQGENLDNENILKMIEVIKENLVNLQVVSNEELKIEIGQNDKNEELGNALENFIQNNKDKKYNIEVEYDEETGLVKYIIMTIFKE